MFTLNCKGKILSLEAPVVMGILNITPDSFYKGYLHDSTDTILGQTANMINHGAKIIDIGGQSTRPDSERISAKEEAERVIPIIKAIHTQFPDVILSIDTYYSSVAREAVESGASIVNDISAGLMDNNMIKTVAALKVPYIIMHMQGTPETMQLNPSYGNITSEVLDFFIQKKEECRKAGIIDLIIDPGFGFGKTIKHNFQLLHELNIFKTLGLPVLAGLSRKSMIYKTLETTTAEALNGTTVLNTLALANGANIIRAHDVKEANETVKLFLAYKNAAQ